MTTIGTDTLTAWIIAFRDRIRANQAELTELDSVIGDADHGANMARGMDAVATAIEGAPPADPAALFKSVGMTLVSTVGGASGPLYGTFFLRLGAATAGTADLDAVSLGDALRAGLDGVVARGKAELGDKTMIDALAPAVDAWQQAAASDDAAGAARAAAAAAETGRDATVPLIARKGRASYLGERSAGHQDPGATSTALLFEALQSAVEAA